MYNQHKKKIYAGGLLLILLVLLAVFASIPQAYASGTITGTVYRDYNENGVNNGTEPGVAGITVTAYDSAGVAQGSTTTIAGGTYSLAATGTGPYRIEFTDAPSYLQSGAIGADSASSVQFIPDGDSSNVDMGVNNPANYCQVNPTAATTRWVNGDPAEVDAPLGTIMTFPYDATSSAEIADKVETGTAWGVAYDAKRDQLYTSAVLRRHAGMGPAGAGAIYAISDPASVTPGAPTTLHTVPSTGSVPTNLDRGLDGLIGATTPNHDAPAFPLVGKVGLGDLEISEDSDTLYAMNLADKLVYTIDLNSPATPAVTLPAFPATACNNGETRPWALKARDGLLYLGVVCSAESVGGVAADLDAYVYAYNGTSWSTVVDNFPLDYPRQANSEPLGSNNAAWRPWMDTLAAFGVTDSATDTRPTPILSDIEFDDNGNMLLGFIDRSGMQFGALNYGTDTTDNISLYRIIASGDLLKATANGDGTYTVEVITSASSDPGQEFYGGDEVDPLSPHRETLYGGLAVLLGSNQVLSSGMDAEDLHDGGVYWMNNTTGEKDDGLALYTGQRNAGLFGKSAGIGDVELLCDPAPLEVGNRLWCDADIDGIQDPGEDTVPAGVTVTMTCGKDSATTTTNATGNYLFTDAIWAAANGGADIPRATSCTISIDTSGADGTTIATACGSSTPSTPNANSGIGDGNDDIRDSDGSQNGSNVEIIITTGSAGENDHTEDFGFIQAADWGDLPDSFDTLSATSGPNHTITSDLYLGSCVDAETDGQPDAMAGNAGGGSGNGDDGNSGAATGSCTNNDDEDGVALTTPLIPGNQACVTVTANNDGAAATLYGWIDFNGDGDFDSDANEALTGGVGGSGGNFSGGSVAITSDVAALTYCFVVPAGATHDGGETHLRFRLTRDSLAGGTPWNGAAASGEVEDYWEPLACVGNYLWIDNGSVANGQDATDTPVADGTVVNLVWGGPDGVIGSGGDDVTYSTTTTSGVYNFCGLTADPNGNGNPSDDSYQIVVPILPGTPVTPNSATDDVDDSDCNVNGQVPVFTLPDPPTSLPTGENSNGDNPGSLNNYPDAQDNLTMDCGFQLNHDWGDAPDTYGTDSTANNSTSGTDPIGPSHLLSSNLYLGSCVDSETSGAPDAGAGTGATGGDDNAAGSTTIGTCADTDDDEDGVDFGTDGPMAGVCTTGNPLNITYRNNTGTAAYVYAWMDFNDNGVFDNPAEVIANGATAADNGGTPSTLNLTYDIPCDAVATTTSYVRVRLDTSSTGVIPTGVGSIGEVEDYLYMQKGWDLGDVNDYNNNQTSYTPVSTNLNAPAAPAGPARHLLVDGLRLGTCVDMETNGQPLVTLNPVIVIGDDANGSALTVSNFSPACATTGDDEDGFNGINDADWSDGSGSIDVTVNGVTAASCVYGWIDWDRDDFTVDGAASNGGNSTASVDVTAVNNGTAFEMIFNNGVPTGNGFPSGLDVPLRLRIVPGTCASTSLGPQGMAVGGEVEDHKITPSSTTAVGLSDVATSLPAAGSIWIAVPLIGLLFVSGIVMIRRRDRDEGTLV